MSMRDRAAQFSPFAALTGYESCIDEAARPVDLRTELDEDTRDKIDRCIAVINGNKERSYHVRIVYFEKDERKEGGRYTEVTGEVRKTDLFRDRLTFSDGREIKISGIADMEIINIFTEM